MLVSTSHLLQAARNANYAIGAFNVYNLEGAKAVVAAAEAEEAPTMLQIHPSALDYGGRSLVELCLTEAEDAAVPMAVHLDHSSSEDAIRAALAAGISSIMADGSHLDFEKNIGFTQEMTKLAHAQDAAVEAELGRISGTEDALTVPEFEARFTNPEQAETFVKRTGVDALAVCIGNVHGRYPRPPQLDFERLAAIREAVDLPLVLHGASGIPDQMVQRAIRAGITKLNVNTEVRHAYLEALHAALSVPERPDLLPLMKNAVAAMEEVVAAKIRMFGASNKATSL